MCCCKKKTLTILGWVFTLIFGVLGIAAIVVAAIPFELLKFDWTSGTAYKSLGVVTLTAVCVVVVVMVFGFIEFCCCHEKKCFGIIYLILQLICVVFALAIALFGLVSGTVGKFSDTVDCLTDFKGILTFWQNFDYLFTLIDIGLCSNDCPCYMTSSAKEAFNANASLIAEYNKWNVDLNDKDKATSFDNCTSLKDFVETKFQDYDKTKGNYIGSLNITKFGSYWNFVEEKFKCTGLCKETYDYNGMYYRNSINRQGKFYKYLFSDVNKGVIEHPGCLKSIVDWLPPLLLSYGVIAFVCSILALFCWFFGLVIVGGCFKKA